MSDRHNDVRFGRPVRIRIAPLTFSRGERERAVLFTNGPFDKGTEWLDDDAFGAITGWRRQHALASMRACLGVLSFAAFGVRHGEQYRAVNAAPYSPEAEAEYERSTRWGEHVKAQCPTWGPWAR